MNELPRYKIKNKTYFRDIRLNEYRNVLNPNDKITLTEGDYLVNEVKP